MLVPGGKLRPWIAAPPAAARNDEGMGLSTEAAGPRVGPGATKWASAAAASSADSPVLGSWLDFRPRVSSATLPDTLNPRHSQPHEPFDFLTGDAPGRGIDFRDDGTARASVACDDQLVAGELALGD